MRERGVLKQDQHSTLLCLCIRHGPERLFFWGRRWCLTKNGSAAGFLLKKIIKILRRRLFGYDLNQKPGLAFCPRFTISIHPSGYGFLTDAMPCTGRNTQSLVLL